VRVQCWRRPGASWPCCPIPFRWSNGHFLAEIPCYRELTGNFGFFEHGKGPGFACGAPEFRGFRANSLFRGTGNSKRSNREYESSEQGIRNRGTGNSKWITGNTKSPVSEKTDQSASIGAGVRRFRSSGRRRRTGFRLARGDQGEAIARRAAQRCSREGAKDERKARRCRVRGEAARNLQAAPSGGAVLFLDLHLTSPLPISPKREMVAIIRGSSSEIGSNSEAVQVLAEHHCHRWRIAPRAPIWAE
jgi:hypothetical protein